MECFPLVTAPVSQARRRRVSFANEVTTLNEEEINTLNADESPEVPPVSPPLTLPVVMEEAAVVSKTGPTPLIMPVVERIEYDSPVVELVHIQTTTPESGVLPPPGFPPFLFPENDGGMDADDICARFGGLASLTFAWIGRESLDIPDETDVPEAGVSLRPSLHSSSEAIISDKTNELSKPFNFVRGMPVPYRRQLRGVTCQARTAYNMSQEDDFHLHEGTFLGLELQTEVAETAQYLFQPPKGLRNSSTK